jgi:ParB family transcriptional regulator, chromosome partitioning protein
VVGRHRLGGALLEQLPFVIAIEVSRADADELMDIEASENVHRREQPPLERAIFVHATCEAAKARIAREHGGVSQQTLAVRSRWDRVKSGAQRAEQALQEESDDTADNLSAVYGWQDSVAEAFGLGKRDIRRSLQLYRLVIEPFPALTQALSDHPVVGNNASELKRIAEVRDEGQRRQVIERLLADPELSADGARELVGIDAPPAGATPLPQEKFYSQIDGGWSRLSAGQRRAYLPRFVGLLSPDLRRRMRELLDVADRGDDAQFADQAPLSFDKLRTGKRHAAG